MYLRSWSPAAGFAVDEVQRGPAATAEIKFRSTGGQEDEVGMHLRLPVGGAGHLERRTAATTTDGPHSHPDPKPPAG